MQAFWDLLYASLGLGIEPKELTFVQITIRGLIVFAAALIMMRIGDRRALARKTAFDTVLLVVLASVLARAVNGSAPFFATLGACFVIVIAHRLLAHVAFHFAAFGNLVKGRDKILVQNGDYRRDTMRQTAVSADDLGEDLRLSAEIEGIEKVKIARLERSGDLSFILKEGAK
jgi:uncharacterized membrane protein YcaP (DUF421 family)